MQLRSLRIFEAVCESRSFGAAAQSLHTVQSNVTAHIKKLEDEIGSLLLERTSPVYPTSAGQTLRHYARQMLQAHDQALAQLQAPRLAPGQVVGKLRIGSMETTAALRLPYLLTRLRARQPGLDLELSAQPTAVLLAELRAGNIDCAFINGTAPDPHLRSWKVFREELVLVSSQPLPGLPTAEEFSASVFLAFKQGCSYRQRIELLMASRGVSAVRIMELGMLDTILGCVAAGMGYALLSRALVEAQQQRFAVHCTSLPQDLAWVDTCFVAGSAPGWSPALRAFAELLDLQGQATTGPEDQPTGPAAQS
ncbi:LysR family transcriptional regulator [Comamonas composti]|uniref:LysR family transcriptional regulator n=1 Tax=Comamonas composti TaxID=408558 RepID=UPI00042459F6|nr:LysR family transcriptional regulator [Comamonas composti]